MTIKWDHSETVGSTARRRYAYFQDHRQAWQLTDYDNHSMDIRVVGQEEPLATARRHGQQWDVVAADHTILGTRLTKEAAFWLLQEAT